MPSRWRQAPTTLVLMGAAPWDELTDGWLAAFGLAWESHCAGSPGVGAVVLDADGTVVASGRSRRGEDAFVPNQLTGSRMAHAEINALAGLAVEEYDGLTLLPTLEPCLLCAAAIAMAHVPAVRFAGPDPMWRFLQGMPRWDPRLAERWPTVVGPMPGKWGAWAALVPIIEESGARWTTLDGRSDVNGTSFVCTNGWLHNAVIAALA